MRRAMRRALMILRRGNRVAAERTIPTMRANVSDEDDWTLAVRGDGRAISRVYDRHRARLFRHAASLISGSADVDDIVAMVFLEAWRKRGSVRFVDGSLLPWLLTTATYSVRNLTRARRRYRGFLERFPRDETVQDDPADAFDAGPGNDALRHLSLRDQEIITLCVIEGLTESEAAHVLGIPNGTVKSRLHRARGRLKTEYEDHNTSIDNETQEIPHEA
jgi:RNA polymerase sigma factor (sigma-70 family)